ncbi:MAG: LCP family protein [Oscillospiraceae bacterium]|nr:LCP family protein [Oscillospiraceae bacterium]
MNSEYIPKAKKEKKKGGTTKKVLLIVLALLLALVLAGGLYVHSKYAQMYDDGDAEGDVEQVDQNLSDAMDSATAELEEKESIYYDGDVLASKDVFNVLLIGTDERTNGEYSDNARGDSCILASINTSGEVPVISLVSLERGMGMPIPWGQYEGQYDWLTHLFRYGGAKMMMAAVEDAFKVQVDYYARINFGGFEQVVNAVGGVTVYLDEAEARYFIDGHIDYGAVVGPNRLDGRRALAYARLREIDSDWQRIQRQREVIFSVLDQCRELSLTELNELADVILPLIKTNIPESKMAELLLLLPQLPNAQTQQATVPQHGTYGGMTGLGGRSLFAVDFETNAKFLHEFLYGVKE